MHGKKIYKFWQTDASPFLCCFVAVVVIVIVVVVIVVVVVVVVIIVIIVLLLNILYFVEMIVILCLPEFRCYIVFTVEYKTDRHTYRQTEAGSKVATIL